MRVWGYVLVAYVATAVLYGSYLIHLLREVRRGERVGRGHAR